MIMTQGSESAEVPWTITHLLRSGLEDRPDDLAIGSETARWTWRDVVQLTNRLARKYLSLGLNPGDRIASLMPNRPALMIHYLACLRAGFVATPLNYRYTPAEVDQTLKISGAEVLLCHRHRWDEVAGYEPVRSQLRHLISYDTDTTDGMPFMDLLQSGDSEQPISEPPLDAPALIYFTSGSTGRPKGVTHTHRTLSGVLSGCIDGMDMTAADTFLPAASFSHIGSSMFGLATLAVGGQLLVPRDSSPEQAISLLREFRPSLMFMLPAALFGVVRAPDLLPDDLSSLRMCVSGGDKVSMELQREFEARAGFAIAETYGMTETGISTINSPSIENRVGSVGKVCPGYECSLRDNDGRPVPVGAEGQFWVRSSANTVGYWGDEQITRETIVDGWLNTGDVMRLDEDGYLWFCGRTKQIIVHDGSNICPQEVEESLELHPAVAQAGVVGVRDSVHGENVRAYVSLIDDQPVPSTDLLIQFSRGRVGYKAPEEVVFLETMPLNPTGKVDRHRLKQWASE